jgi:hypothetical protein
MEILPSSQKISWIRTKEFLIINQAGRTFNIHINDSRYKEAIEMLKNKEFEMLIGFLNPHVVIDEYTEGTFFLKNGNMYIRGIEEIPVHDSIAERIIEFKEKGLPYEPLLKFAKNIILNPSERSREQLYRFLEHNKMPITPDGYFIAYKKVSKVGESIMDSHSRKYDNSPGSRLVMNRDDVNSDPNQTCSHGLHVAAYEYASGFSGQIMVQVKVNPKDVVSVPIDYNNQKIRCCEYLVMSIIDGEIKEDIFEGDTREKEKIVHVKK